MDPPQQAGPLTALVMRLLSDDATERPTASQARDALAPIAEGKPPASGKPSTGTAVLDVGAAAVAAAAAGLGRGPGAGAGGDRCRAAPGAAPAGPAAAAVPPVAPAAAARRPARRRPLLIALAAVLVVGLGVLAAVLTSGTDPGTGSPAPTTEAAAPAPAAPVRVDHDERGPDHGRPPPSTIGGADDHRARPRPRPPSRRP